MIFNYLVDESLPSTIPFFTRKNFKHVSQLDNVRYDTDIWQHALQNDLIIVTTDTNFYYKSMSTQGAPKVVWIKAGKINSKKLDKLFKSSWKKVERKLLSESFIKLNIKK